MLTAECEAIGFPEIAKQAHAIWRLHELGMSALENWLSEVRQ